MKTLYFNCKVLLLLHMLTVMTTMIKQDYFFNCTTVTNFFMQNVTSHFYILILGSTDLPGSFISLR